MTTDYTKLDDESSKVLYSKSVDKIERLEKELKKQMANIRKRINRELLNKKRIAKAIRANNDFVLLEDTQMYKDYQNLDAKTKEKLKQEIEEDIQRGVWLWVVLLEKRVERDLNKLKTGFDAEVTLEISAFLDKLKNTQNPTTLPNAKEPKGCNDKRYRSLQPHNAAAN